jgi:hypothetical protein
MIHKELQRNFLETHKIQASQACSPSSCLASGSNLGAGPSGWSMNEFSKDSHCI